MSGTLHGSIDHNIAAGISEKPSRDIFAAAANYFDSKFTKIAWQKGSGFSGTGALGGYTSDTNRSGDNAFGVWRWDRIDGKKLYILLQWAYNSNLGVSPGNPATNNQLANTVGIQFAMRLDGGNPWNGTTVNDGTDTKNGTSVWTAGASTLLVWPRVNDTGGSSTTKSGLMAMMPGTTVAHRFGIMSDDDSLYWYSTTTSTSVSQVGFFGPYSTRSGITPNLGYVCLNSTQSAPSPADNTVYGTTTGNSTREGGASINAAGGVRACRTFILSSLGNSIYQKNNLASGTPYDVIDVFICMDDSTGPTQGLIGKLNVSDIAVTYNMPNFDTNVGKTRVCIGDSSLASWKWLIPWNGSTTPNSTASQTGVQF